MPNKTANTKFGFRPCSHGTGQIYALRSHETDETGRIRAQLTGRICDLLKIRSRFLWDRSQIFTNPCEQRNQSFS